MKKNLAKRQKLIRELKDIIISNYYHWRIDTVSNPYQIFLRRKPYKILFILSHMRSGSSLLTHILNSNSAIVGYGETHINYTSELDFKELMFRVYWRIRDYQMGHEYILDKVLHNEKFFKHDFLTSEKVYAIFLLREPKRSLASMLDLKPHWNEQDAIDYYCERLSMLENYAKIINDKERSLFISYEQLLEHTDSVFDGFKKLLKTKTQFSENYEILRTTGLSGIGDQSQNIKAGCIIRNPRHLEQTISQELIEKGINSFNHCYETLSKYCSIIPH